MSRTDDRDAVFDWPRCARSLFTVLAAISFARFVDVPRDFALSLMCSYFRSCFSVHSPLGMAPPSVGGVVSQGRFPTRTGLTPRLAHPRRPATLGADVRDVPLTNAQLAEILARMTEDEPATGGSGRPPIAHHLQRREGQPAGDGRGRRRARLRVPGRDRSLQGPAD